MWKRLQRNASYSVISLVVIALLGFVAMYFNARALGVEGLGAYAAVVALGLMLETMSGMQAWQAIMALPHERENRILGAALVVSLGAATLAAVVGIGLALLLELEGGWATIFHMATLCLRIPDPFIGVLRKHDHFRFIAAARTNVAVLTVIIAAALWFAEAGLVAYVVTAALVRLAFVALLMWRAWPISPPERPTRQDIGEFVRFSIPTGLSGAVGSIKDRGIVVLLTAFADSSAVGLYAVADRIANVMQMAYRALYEAVFREMPGARDPLRLIGGIGLAGLGLAAPVLVFAYFFGADLVRIAAGPAFIGASGPLLVLLAVTTASMATLGMRAWVIVKIGPKSMLMCNTIALSALAAAPYFIGQWGAVGAAYTLLLFEAIWTLATLVLLVRNRAVLAGEVK